MFSPTVIGTIAGILTAVSLVPQLVKMIKERKFDTISPVMLIVLMAGLGMWIVYGIMRDDLPIILTNAFSFLVNTSMIVLRLLNGKSAPSSGAGKVRSSM